MDSDLLTQRTMLSSAKERRAQVSKLRLAWNQYNLNPEYQALGEECLSFCRGPQLAKEVTRQINITETGESALFELSERGEERKSILQELKITVIHFDSISFKTQNHIAHICQTITQLRTTNLLFAQCLIRLLKYYQQLTGVRVVGSKIQSLIESLHQDNGFLAKSLMRKYIIFSKSYDPFLLKHHEILKATDNPRLKELPSIEQLFTLAPALYSRLRGAHDKLASYLSQNRRLFLNREASSKQSETESINYRRMSNQDGTRHDNKIYLGNKSVRTETGSPKALDSRDSKLTLVNTKRNHPRQQRDISPPEEKMYFPRINTISSNKSISNDIEKQHKQKQTLQIEKRKRTAMKKSINLVEEQEEEFRNYIAGKRFAANGSQSSSPNVRFRKKKIGNRTGINADQQKETIVQQPVCVSVSIQAMEDNGPTETENLSNAKKSPQKQKVMSAKSSQKQILPLKNEDLKITTPIEKQKRVTNDLTKTKKEAQEGQTPSAAKPTEDSHGANKEKKPVSKKSQSPEKRYKLRAAQKPQTIKQLFEHLKGYKIKEEYRSKFQIGNWQNSIAHNQYYVHKSYINDELQAVSLCCALPEGDIMVKYWGPLETCDEQMSNFLFSKYLQHLEKNTNLKSVYYNALPIRQLALNSFIKRKERIFQRERVNPSIHPKSYTYFLEITFTNVAVQKSIQDQSTLINQAKVELFQNNKFVIFNYLLIINKLSSPGVFSSIAAYYPKIKSIKAAQQTILSHYLSAEAYNSSFACSYCNLLALKLRTPIFSAFFIADQGYINLAGEICFEDEQQLVISLPMLKHNTRLYFGKGMKNVHEMVERVRQRWGKDNQKVQFSIRMFRKCLRGVINCINLKDENCYGDLQISFIWKDYLKGKLSHPIKDAPEVFDSQFYCLVETEREILFAFEVLPSDFVNPKILE